MNNSPIFPLSLLHFTNYRKFSRYKNLLLFLTPLLFYQCTREQIVAPIKPETNSEITVRTCLPGSYSVSNGRIVFSDRDDYQDMLDFLECASVSDIEDWSDDFTLETAGKSYRDFWDAVSDPNLTESGYGSLKTSYQNKVKFTTNSDGDDEFAPKFQVFEELCNLNGEFQVENTVFKVTEDKFISIIDTTVTSPSSVNNSTTTDSTAGVFVRNLSVSSGGCCPSVDQEINVYQTTPPRRRLRTEYRVLDVSEVYEDYFSPGNYLFVPILTALADSRHQVRRCFIFICTWNCERVSLYHEIDIEFSHDADNWGITDPCTYADSDGPLSNTCRMPRMQQFFGGTAYSLHAVRIPNIFQTCVTDVELTCINSSQTTPVSVSINCP